MHRLSNIDAEARMADCEECGRVEVVNRKNRDGRIWACRIARRIDKARYRKNNPSVSVQQNYTKAYGAGAYEAKQRFLISQDYRCALCNDGPLTMKSGNLDHCHETGKLRGVLCRHCNLGLGHFKDSAESLQAAIDYLQAF